MKSPSCYVFNRFPSATVTGHYMVSCLKTTTYLLSYSPSYKCHMTSQAEIKVSERHDL